MNPLTLYLRSPRLNTLASRAGAKKSEHPILSLFLLEPQNETETHLPFFICRTRLHAVSRSSAVGNTSCAYRLRLRITFG